MMYRYEKPFQLHIFLRCSSTPQFYSSDNRSSPSAEADLLLVLSRQKPYVRLVVRPLPVVSDLDVILFFKRYDRYKITRIHWLSTLDGCEAYGSPVGLSCGHLLPISPHGYYFTPLTINSTEFSYFPSRPVTVISHHLSVPDTMAASNLHHVNYDLSQGIGFFAQHWSPFPDIISLPVQPSCLAVLHKHLHRVSSIHV